MPPDLRSAAAAPCFAVLPQRTQEELHSLQNQADTSRRRLARAERLTGALAEESVRWLQRSDELTAALRSLVGDVFLAAACISYLGPFTGPYREALLRGWAARCREAGIPTSADGGAGGAGGGCGSFSLPATLVSPVEIREWGVQVRGWVGVGPWWGLCWLASAGATGRRKVRGRLSSVAGTAGGAKLLLLLVNPAPCCAGPPDRASPMTACPWTTACSSHVATGGRCALTHRYARGSTPHLCTLKT